MGSPFIRSASPAKAGAQMQDPELAGAALRYFHLPNWAPAFAGEA
jgi:hypothetical protein